MSSLPPAVRWPRAFAALALVLVLELLALQGGSHATATPVASHPGRAVEAIVRFDAGVPAARGRAVLRAHGATVTRDLHLINGFGARLAAGGAAALAHEPEVAAVTLNSSVATTAVDAGAQLDGPGALDGDGPVAALDGLDSAFVQSTRTDHLWARTGSTGQGIRVAVLDTGVAGDAVDFTNRDGSSRVVATAVTNPDATDDEDHVGHGTHVAGLVAGNSSVRPRSDALRNQHFGTAPGSDIVSVKVSDDAGATSVLDVIYGLQFAVDHAKRYRIRVVNLSLSALDPGDPATDPLDAAVDAAWLHGLVVVAAAGNRGSADDAVDYAPGNDPFAITVGAVDDQGTKSTGDDALTSWSSRGTTQDGTAKPDVVAPGAHVVSVLAPDSDYAARCPACVTGDGQYLRLGGTSSAAPIVAGIAADLIALHPGWTPDQVKGALTSTLRHTADGRGQEVDASRADRARGARLTANADAVPSQLIDPATGDIDPTRASWSRASWSRASWSRASWSCDCAGLIGDAAQPVRASWSRASWSSSFTK